MSKTSLAVTNRIKNGTIYMITAQRSKIFKPVFCSRWIGILNSSTFIVLAGVTSTSIQAAEAYSEIPASIKRNNHTEQQEVKQLAAVQVVGRRVSNAEIAIGNNQSHSTVAITQNALLSAPAGTSGLKMLENLVGFNVQTNDPLGLYELGNSVSVRAFNVQQIGFALDGIPLGRSDSFGGSPIFRYVDNENTNRVIASTGTGDVSFPTYASLGPVVNYQTVNPAKTAGGTVVATLGSEDLRRSFIKLESGEHQGWSAYVSRSKIDSDLWRGPGAINREHIEGKLRYHSDAGHDIQLKVIHNDIDDFDVPGLNYQKYTGQAGDPFGRSGRYFGYIADLPNLPETVAGVRFSNPNYNQYYKLAINRRQDTLYGLSGKFLLGPALENQSSLYYENKKGSGVSPEAYATSLANYNAEKNIISGLYAPRGLEYGLSGMDGERYGGLTSFKLNLDQHDLEAGIWLENDKYHRTQARYNLVDGNPSLAPLFNEPVHLQRDYQSERQIAQLNVKDTWKTLADQLAVTVGAKALDMDYQVQGYRNPADYINQRQPVLSAHWKDNFLPYIGAVYKLNNRDQLFASWSQQLALPRGADDAFTQSAPNVPVPQPETAENFEIGYRLNHPRFNASLAAYHTQFDNRIQPYASLIPGSSQTETWYQNVGRSTAWGAELSGIWKPQFSKQQISTPLAEQESSQNTWAQQYLADKLFFNGNLTYNRTKLNDNLANLSIRNNSIPDSPELMAQLGSTYEASDWAVINLSARYTAKRYTNLSNTETVPSYTLLNAYLDFSLPSSLSSLQTSYLHDVKLRFNIDNILDKDYIGTVLPTVNTPATFLSGAARSYQASLSFSF